MQFGYFPQPRHYADNLLINPRGVINQANEADGVLSANQYFRDGWKAGANGAEVYVEPDGFRLVSGSIVQVIENTFEVGTKLRANLDVVSGSPVFNLGGSGHLHTVADNAHITLEISGANSKFSQLAVAKGAVLPTCTDRTYSAELARCQRFMAVVTPAAHNFGTYGSAFHTINLNWPQPLRAIPSLTYQANDVQVGGCEVYSFTRATETHARLLLRSMGGGANHTVDFKRARFVADARL